MKPLLSVVMSKRRCRVAVLENDGAVRVARDYDNPGSGNVETP